MTTKKIKTSDILGENYYTYELTSSNYTPALNGSITITCTMKDVYGAAASSKSITLYQNGTSKGAKTTNSSGVATWSITCSSAGIQSFKVGSKSIEIFVDNKSNTDHTHNKKIYYGYTDTSPNTRVKEVIVDGNFILEDGILLILSSTYDNTYSDTYYHTQLNINNTGAVDVYGSWIDGTSYSSIEINGRWQSKETIILYYDSDKWVLIDDGIATTTNYGATKLQDSLSNDTNSAITPNAVNTAINNHTHSQYLTEHQSLANYVTTSDSRLSDARTPTSHAHGNLSNDGKITTSHNGTYSTFIGVQDSTGTLYKASKINSDIIIDGTAHANIGSNANDNQSAINTAINTALGNKANSTHSHSLSSLGGTVTVEKLATAESGYLSSYAVKQNGVQVGNTINIPKDFLVKSGSVKTVSTANNPVSGYSVGDKYIDLVINVQEGTSTDSHIYILVSDLIDTPVTISDVTGLQSALDGKASSSHNHNIKDLNATSTYGDEIITEGADCNGTGLSFANGKLIYNSASTEVYYDKNGNADEDSGNILANLNDIPNINGKENTSNKVTSLSSSSTDTQYPSAKVVYNSLNEKADKTSVVDWDNIVFVDKADDATGSIILNFLS